MKNDTPDTNTAADRAQLLENLARLEHEQWAKRINYMLELDVFNDDVSDITDNWIRQKNTDYLDLSEPEKESDRVFARKVMYLFDKHLTSHAKSERRKERAQIVVKLDEMWNCNCLTDESLERTECECSGNPANEFREQLGESDGN